MGKLLCGRSHQSPSHKKQHRYTDKEIDQMVYELYGLSADEIKIVEGEN